MFKFEKLDVWRKSVDFNKVVIKIADDLPKQYQFSFGEQLRRALLSITNNIAEGCGRNSSKEQANFYNMAKGSVYEVVNVLVVLSELGKLSISRDKKRTIYDSADEICRMLSGLIKRRKNVS